MTRSRTGQSMTMVVSEGNRRFFSDSDITTNTNYGRYYTQIFESQSDTNDPEAFFGEGIVTSLDGLYQIQVEAIYHKEEMPKLNEDTNLVLRMEGRNLRRKITCTDEAFESGTFSFIDAANNVVKATFENCSVVWTYNDAVVELPKREEPGGSELNMKDRYDLR